MRHPLLCLCLLFPFFVQGTQLQPWLPRYLELQPKASYLYQAYNSVSTGERHRHRKDRDHFLNLSLSTACAVYGIEVETDLGATRHRKFTFSDLALTGRYQFLDDVIGDPVSVIGGLTIAQVFRLARNDISNFYHGGIQGEAHVSVGKEWQCWNFWRSRLWGVGVFGVADIGSPWLRFDFGWEYNWWDINQIGLYLKSRGGFGGRDLKIHHFSGYGPVAYRVIDISFEARHHFESGFIVGCGAGYRILAKNCPRCVCFLSANLLYPFGL